MLDPGYYTDNIYTPQEAGSLSGNLRPKLAVSTKTTHELYIASDRHNHCQTTKIYAY